MASLTLNRLGVMNLTPNSFSDGGELSTLKDLQQKILDFKSVEGIDFGAESTAPMNSSITKSEEWARFSPFLAFIKSLPMAVSIDTYKPETIEHFARIWTDEKISNPLIWNDVSGKFDSAVKEFLKLSPKFHYVFCHNLAPSRELTGKHMDYVSDIPTRLLFLNLQEYFSSYKNSQVIFDPNLGFSKTYEQNWYILEHFASLQKMIGHNRWMLGFSRKSFLKKRFGTDSRDELDLLHQEVLRKVTAEACGELWIRTHRPELIE